MQLYRRMLALPGVRTLMVLTFFARIPCTAAGMVLTLHIAVEMGRGYGAAGTVGAVCTIGIAVGAPVMGRVVDRFGLRPMLAVTTFGEAAFWVVAPHLSYTALLVCGFVGGMLVLPAMSIGRQAIAALVPEDLRRTAYSMDSVSTELSFMVGPAAAVFVSTQFTTETAMLALACGIVLVGGALFAGEPGGAQRVGEGGGHRRARAAAHVADAAMVGVLIVGAGAVFILAGTEVAIVAQLRSSGELGWTAWWWRCGRRARRSAGSCTGRCGARSGRSR